MVIHQTVMWGSLFIYIIPWPRKWTCLLRLIFESGEPDGSPGFRDQKAGVRAQEHVPTVSERLCPPIAPSSIYYNRRKMPDKLYRGSRNVLGGMRKGDCAEHVDYQLGCKGHEIGQVVYCMLTIGHSPHISRSNMPRIQGSCEA